MSDAHSLPAVGCARLENRGRMPEGLHLKNVSVSSSFVGPFGGCWRMPAGVHGPSGSNPVLGLPTKVDWEISRQLLSPVRKTCGECRGNYMTLWDPVRLRAAAPELRWSNGRTTMRRFSANCRRRPEFLLFFSVEGGPNADWDYISCHDSVSVDQIWRPSESQAPTADRACARGRFLLANAGGSTWTRGSSITASGQFE